MSTGNKPSNLEKEIIKFKSASFNVPVLVILENDINLIAHKLEEKISQAPDFFRYSPLIMDIKSCQSNEDELNLAELITCLHNLNLFPIGIKGANKEQSTYALSQKIPEHRSNVSYSEIDESNQIDDAIEIQQDKETQHTVADSLENKLISQPIRSGQKVYASGDLTILSHVSAGAEVIADGNIHVYGSLRGRAMAGVHGNTDSRIFCLDLKAELISIAGHYKISEELENVENNQPMQIYLQDQTLIIDRL